MTTQTQKSLSNLYRKLHFQECLYSKNVYVCKTLYDTEHCVMKEKKNMNQRKDKNNFIVLCIHSTQQNAEEQFYTEPLSLPSSLNETSILLCSCMTKNEFDKSKPKYHISESLQSYKRTCALKSSKENEKDTYKCILNNTNKHFNKLNLHLCKISCRRKREVKQTVINGTTKPTSSTMPSVLKSHANTSSYQKENNTSSSQSKNIVSSSLNEADTKNGSISVYAILNNTNIGNITYRNHINTNDTTPHTKYNHLFFLFTTLPVVLIFLILFYLYRKNKRKPYRRYIKHKLHSYHKIKRNHETSGPNFCYRMEQINYELENTSKKNEK